ncbi:tRNA (cytidine(32)/uridine(32)-2'-O)-methyltransferase [hydrothermal vent metagenome]|uniref:tRNA (Cytidine(32)/uridine(32)-2'-O)-methyltransferase n=1 Tax=hydrothermal vent metagenome TaxID=652676 RepID=A0A3B0SJQ5_9ZZZZ
MSETAKTTAPVIILSHPQMGENIGAAARVMCNFGLHELRLIAPRDGWPNEKSTTLAAGAFAQMLPVRVFEDSKAAVADLQMVFAVSARIRDMEKPVFSPEQAIQKIKTSSAKPAKTGFLFGAESSGLDNAQVCLCDAVVTYPINADFHSLNLAQAVAVLAYAWRSQGDDENLATGKDSAVASKAEMDGMLGQFCTELRNAGFFHPPEKEGLMMQNIQNMMIRCAPTVQEVRTFRGVIKALAKGRGPFRQ